MPEKKLIPTFGFIPYHEGLYVKESRVKVAIERVADFREKEWNEHKWKCALPEAIYNVLDSYTEQNVIPAVNNWLTVLAVKILKARKMEWDTSDYQQMIDSCKNFLKMLGEGDESK